MRISDGHAGRYTQRAQQDDLCRRIIVAETHAVVKKEPVYQVLAVWQVLDGLLVLDVPAKPVGDRHHLVVRCKRAGSDFARQVPGPLGGCLRQAEVAVGNPLRVIAACCTHLFDRDRAQRGFDLIVITGAQRRVGANRGNIDCPIRRPAQLHLGRPAEPYRLRGDKDGRNRVGEGEGEEIGSRVALCFLRDRHIKGLRRDVERIAQGAVPAVLFKRIENPGAPVIAHAIRLAVGGRDGKNERIAQAVSAAEGERITVVIIYDADRGAQGTESVIEPVAEVVPRPLDRLPGSGGGRQGVRQSRDRPGEQDQHCAGKQRDTDKIYPQLGRGVDLVYLPAGAVMEEYQPGDEYQGEEKVGKKEPDATCHIWIVIVNHNHGEPGRQHHPPRACMAGQAVTGMHTQHPEKGGHEKEEEQAVGHDVLFPDLGNDDHQPVHHTGQALGPGHACSVEKPQLPGHGKSAVSRPE